MYQSKLKPKQMKKYSVLTMLAIVVILQLTTIIRNIAEKVNKESAKINTLQLQINRPSSEVECRYPIGNLEVRSFHRDDFDLLERADVLFVPNKDQIFKSIDVHGNKYKELSPITIFSKRNNKMEPFEHLVWNTESESWMTQRRPLNDRRILVFLGTTNDL